MGLVWLGSPLHYKFRHIVTCINLSVVMCLVLLFVVVGELTSLEPSGDAPSLDAVGKFTNDMPLYCPRQFWFYTICGLFVKEYDNFNLSQQASCMSLCHITMRLWTEKIPRKLSIVSMMWQICEFSSKVTEQNMCAKNVKARPLRNLIFTFLTS